MKISPSRRGLAVLYLWLLLLGALVGAFVFWQSLRGGLVFLCLFAGGAALYVFVRLGSLVVRVAGGELRADCGVLFLRLRSWPLRYLAGVSRFDTPLLRLAGCCLVLVHFSGGAMLLAPLDARDAGALCAAMEAGSRR